MQFAAQAKAGEERSFWTVETNFLPGRTFVSLEDINQQALQWSTVRLDNRPQGKAGLIPAQAFEWERTYLHRLPEHLPAPYRVHQRQTDQYGYTAFDGNFYWVPGTRRDPLTLLQYANDIKIFTGRQFLIAYPLPPDGVKNKPFFPQGQAVPRHHPNNRKRPALEEEKRLRALGDWVGAYLDFVLQTKGLQRHQFLRRLLALSRKMTPELFIKSIQRAHKYRITNLSVLQRIAILQLAQEGLSWPTVDLDETFQNREAYQQGAWSEEPNLTLYDPPPQEDDSDDG